MEVGTREIGYMEFRMDTVKSNSLVNLYEKVFSKTTALFFNKISALTQSPRR
jgi:transcription elongation factor GreA-like protein